MCKNDGNHRLQPSRGELLIKFGVHVLDGVFVIDPAGAAEDGARAADGGGGAFDEGRAQEAAADGYAVDRGV